MRASKQDGVHGKAQPDGVKTKALTAKQAKFAEVYDGNGTKACRLAGYKGSDNVMAQQARDNLSNPQIREAIRTREKAEVRPLVATRQQRQAFWTSVMGDVDEVMFARLRASELLGKSEADFTEKVEHQGTLRLEVVDPYAVKPGGDE